MSTTDKKVYSNKIFFKTLWHFIKPYKWRFSLATLSRLVSDIVWLYPTYAIAEIVNFLTKYTEGADLTRLYWITGLLIVVTAVHVALKYVAKFMGYRVAERTYIDSYLESSEHMFDIDIAWHTTINAGNKFKKIQKGSESVKEVIYVWYKVIIKVIVQTIGMIAIISAFDWVIGLVMIIFAVFYGTNAYFLIRRAARASHEVNIAEEGFTGVLFEVINNIRSAKLMGMLRMLIEKIGISSEGVWQKLKNKVFWFTFNGFVQGTLGHVFRLTIVVVVIIGILNGRYELGFLFLIYNYFNKIWEALMELADLSQRLAVAKYGIARMADIMDQPIVIDDEVDKCTFDKDWKKIELRNLSFAYENDGVLQDVSLTIHRGERLGIIGLSGAGKSTLFKILLKEYEDYTGEVLVDDVPLRDISKKNYFDHAAVVLQDTEVFNFTIEDNITISNYDERENKQLFNKAVTTAHIDEIIERLPNKEKTFIGEKGVKLSGGEKQRLGLARAVFKDPQILFLDEATSHLDVESEGKIQDSLHAFFQNITAVVIAHRLSTIKEMDRILVMEAGQIIEEGSFEDLYNKEGRFRELWDKQKI